MANDSLRLLLSRADAAKALSLSQKTLWNRTYPRGPIPCVRIGARVLYAVVDLESFIGQATEGQE